MKHKVGPSKSLRRCTVSQSNQKKRKKTKINKIRDEKENIITNINEIQKINRKYFETYSNELENLDEMDKFLNSYGLSKFTQESINHLNRSIMVNEFETIRVS
jgi:hypothetical protein